ncbi:MAG: hypothetical protein V3575_04450 [Candidatus Absconditabacteria bacterium]
MNQYRITKYTRVSRYVILVITLIFFVFLIKRLLNVSEQDKYIDEVKISTKTELEKDSYNKNFYMKYLQSDYAKYFKSHEKGITMEGEQIVKFQFLPLSNNNEIESSNLTGEDVSNINNQILNITDPKDAWKHFINGNIEYFKEQF